MMLIHPDSRRIAGPFAIFAAAALSIACASPELLAQSESGFTYNGMDYISYQANEYLEIPQGPNGTADLRSDGANYTAVMATWYVQTYDSTSIAPDSSSPTDAAVVAAIKNLQAQGIAVTLKPHVDSLDGIWRGDFTWPSTDTTNAEQQTWLTAWFTSYESFILHFAQIASENNVGILVIGTEYTKLTGNTCSGSCQTYWDQYVINPLREMYPNLLLAYGANATSAGDEFTTVSFWGGVDIIGVDGYFPIDSLSDCDTSSPPDPTVAQLVSGWTDNPCSGGFNAVAALRNLSSAYPGTPLIFTEIGYPSATGSNAAPYNYSPTGTYDPSEQQNCYEAFFEVFSQQTSWMKGVFWWDWSVSPPGTDDTGYSPQTKPAETTLQKWYGSTTPGFTLAPFLSNISVGTGLSTTDTISVTPLGGFTGTVTLATSGLPSGVTASFAAGAGGTQVLTLTASSIAYGFVTVTITGTSGSLTATTTVQLDVIDAESQTITFTSPGDQQVGTQLALMATASSGLPVTFASTMSSVCTVSGSTASLSATGTCTIQVTQAGNGIYLAATSVSESFQVTALTPVPVPSNAEMIVTQVNWLTTLTGYIQTSNNPTGGSFAINANGAFAVADTDNIYLINGLTGATTTLGAWAGASAIAMDSSNNLYIGSLYGTPEAIVKLPYIGGASNGGYAAFTTPTTGLAPCTASSTTECIVSHAGSVYPEAMAFDSAGDLFWITEGDGNTLGYTANGIFECTVACLGGTGNPVELYQERLASIAPSAASGQLIAGGLAIDSAGNIFFTDSSSFVAPAPSYSYTSFYSDLNELPTSTGVGYGGKMTGYSASPTVLFTFTPEPAKTLPYDNQVDAVAVVRNKAGGDTVYFADQSNGIFGFPDTSGGIPTVNGQPTALYAVSPQGAKTLTADSQGNLYLGASSSVINTNGADTLAEVPINNLRFPASPVDITVYTGGNTIPSTGITSGSIFAMVNDGVATPTVSVTLSEFGSINQAEFFGFPGSAVPMIVGQAVPLAVRYSPLKVGERSALLTSTDTSSGSTAAATTTGVGQGPLLNVDPGVWTAYPASPAIGFGAGNAIRVDGAGDIFVGDGSALFEIAAGSPSSVAPTEIASGFSSISDMVFDANGDLYVADSIQQEVIEIPSVNGSLSPASQTTAVSRSTTFDGSPVSTPGRLAVGPDGLLYIGELGTGNVDTYNPTNGFTTVRIAGLTGIEGIAVDAADNLYVATSASNGAENVGSVLDYSSGAGVTSVSLGSIIPANIVVDPSGSVLIPDQTTGDIVRIPIVSGTLASADAITVENLTGAAGAIALDANGNLYANDRGNDTVFAIQRSAGALTFTTPVNDGAVSSPLNLYVENTGNLTLSASATSTVTGPFTLTAGTPACTATIAAGADCGEEFEFSPTGTESGTQTGSANIGGLTTVTLSGTAVAPPPPSFTLSPSAPTLSVAQGSSSVDTITIHDLGGFNGSVSLAASGLPTGVTASFGTGFTGTQVLTLTASATATLGGPVTVTITGTSVSLTGTATIQLTVTAPVPSFALAPTTGALSVTQGNNNTDTITVTPANGFTGSVTLSATGMPNGVTASFNPNPTSTGSSVLTLTASGTAAVGGPVTVTITGTSGSLTETITLALTVNVAPGFSLSPSPGSLTVIQGNNGTSTISVTDAGGFTGGVTLAASGLPSGVAASFNPNPTSTGSSVLTLTASSTAIVGGPVTVTITGTSGTLTASTTISLTVNLPPSFTLSPTPASVSVVQGSTATETITVTGAGGFSGAVSLSASGLPSGVSAAFAAGTVSGTQVMTLTASSTATVGGPVTATIHGTTLYPGGPLSCGIPCNLTASTTIMVTVNIAPGFTLSASPNTLSIAQTASGTSTISMADVGGFSANVTLAAFGLPNGMTASFAAGTVAGTQVLTLTASNTATVGGPVTVTITGTSGTLTASTTIALTVTAELTFTGSNSSSTLSIEPGATTGNTVVITVTPSNGFSGTVNLSYSITPTAASDPATCTFTPSSVTISGTTSQQSTLAVITAASATSKNQIKRLFWPSAGGTAFALVLLFGVRRRRHNWLAMLGLLVLFGSIGAISCGGNGGGSGGGGGGVGTTAGSYSITVTGTSGDTVVTVSTIALTVQ